MEYIQIILYFSPIQTTPEMSTETQVRKCTCNCHCPRVERTTVVRELPRISQRDNNNPGKERQSIHSNGSQGSRTPKYSTNCWALLKRKVRKYKFSKEATELYLSSWDEKTKRQYNVYLRKWVLFCTNRNKDPSDCSLRTGVEFLVSMFKQNYAYSSINTARSALSNVLREYEGVKFGKHFTVCRIMKGVYRKRPQISRYQFTWDINLILELLKSWGPNKFLKLQRLTKKLAALMLITSCQRVQTLAKLKISDLFWNKDKSTGTFRLSELLKHSRRGTLGVVTFRQFVQDQRLCVVHTLKEYLFRTRGLRKKIDYLFVSIRGDHIKVKESTIAGWVKDIMKLSGVDISVFKPHSVRGATTSKLSTLKVPVKSIMDKASWKCQTTFEKFYNKDVISENDIENVMLKNFIQSK